MPSLKGSSAFGERFVDSIINNPKRYLVLGMLMAFALLPGMQFITADFTHTGFF